MSLRSAPSAVASHIPGMNDPVEALKGAQQHQVQSAISNSARSSLESLPDVKPRNRKTASAETV
jgi:hypothetical protein